MIRRALILVAIIIGLGPAASFAQAEKRVVFARGTSRASVKAVIRGYGHKDYLVRARAGQTIELDLNADMPSAFWVFLPDGENLKGAVGEDQFSGTLPVDGDYVIRVEMIPSAARRKGAVTNFTLKISIK